MWNQSRRLYVVEFKTGVIKIGCTKQPGDRRIASLRQQFGAITRMHYGAHHDCGFWAEQQAIKRLSRIACRFKGREWFTGIRFGAAVHLIEQITSRAPKSETSPSL